MSKTNANQEEEEEQQQQDSRTKSPVVIIPPEKKLRHVLGLMDDNVVSDTSNNKEAAVAGGAATGPLPPSPLVPVIPKIIGHRGALYECIENTRPSFLRCVELQCYGVELDVFCIRDGNVVVFHGGGSNNNNNTPGDLTNYFVNVPPISSSSSDTNNNKNRNNKSTSILDWTYPECQTLQFNPHSHEFAHCPPNLFTTTPSSSSQQQSQEPQIPLLKHVLMDLKNTGLQIKIELKGPQTVKPVLELVESLDMVSQCCYSSFDYNQLRYLRQLRPNKKLYPTGALFGDTPCLPENNKKNDNDKNNDKNDDKNKYSHYLDIAKYYCGATEVHLPYDWCTVQRIQDIHNAGLLSMAWFKGPINMKYDMKNKYWDVGNEDETCYGTIRDTGVQQICLNKPHIAYGMGWLS